MAATSAPARSLFYFGADSESGGDKYRLLLEGARLADELGFAAVWVPERHFVRFGGLYPSAAVAGAMVAAITRRVAVRAGSVVVPLNDPLRVAEEWAMIDNVTQGRVGIAAASGWHANDFVLAPAEYARRRESLRDKLALVQRLWRGEQVALPNGDGVEVPVSIRPRPVQSELPIWITAASDASFESAGAMGFNVLTANFANGYAGAELERRIGAYRAAIERAHGRRGHVTLMVHTYVAASEEELVAIARPAMADYIAANKEMAATNTSGHDAARLAAMSPRERRILEGLFAGTVLESELSLVGTAEACARKIDGMRARGVDEIACLVDFGVPVDDALASIRRLATIE